MTPAQLTKFYNETYNDGYLAGIEAGRKLERNHPADDQITKLLQRVTNGSIDLDEAMEELCN